MKRVKTDVYIRERCTCWLVDAEKAGGSQDLEHVVDRERFLVLPCVNHWIDIGVNDLYDRRGRYVK